MDIIRNYRAEYIVILAGDHIYKMDYSRMLLDHVNNDAKFTVACHQSEKRGSHQLV
ncbi:Glucose-1-phosphate adenylyltransferase [Providencia stuartii]|nr:Glucose-1-phosphate adenylyltransferase [Providencia stuartii]